MKINITKILKVRKYYKIASALLLIILIGVLVKAVIFKNSKESKSETLLSDSVNIAKSLEAYQRPEGTNNTSFNPYALQDGDVIKVNIKITGVDKQFDIEDNILKIPYGPYNASCSTENGDFSPAGVDEISDSGFELQGKVVWMGLVPDANKSKEVYYYCKVQN